MGGRKILITVTEEQYGMLNVLAKESGLERVSTFVKSEVIKGAQEKLNPASERKNIIVPVTNYEELSGYVEQKKFGSIASFATFAMESVMQRNQLTEAQKARIGKSIG